MTPFQAAIITFLVTLIPDHVVTMVGDVMMIEPRDLYLQRVEAELRAGRAMASTQEPDNVT
jgi:hypothetical protein